MQRVVLEQHLGFVATVTPDGRPNLSPKGTTTVLDDEHLMFADIVSPNTSANLAHNPHVELNVVDPIRRRGYRFRGTAVVHREGPEFERAIDVMWARGSTTARSRVRAMVVIAVSEAAELVSPAYDVGATEAELVAKWREHHLDLRG